MRKTTKARQDVAGVFIATASLLVIVLFTKTSLGKDALGSVESVLDKLEKQLLARENDAAIYPEPALPTAKSRKLVANDVVVPKHVVQATPREVADLEEIGGTLGELQTEVDKLTAEINSARQRILDEVKLDTRIEVNAFLNEKKTAGVSKLRIRLDGIDLYDIEGRSGIWLPDGKIPIYLGPLQPGLHSLDVQAQFLLRTGDGLPPVATPYRYLSQSFDIDVPHDKFKRQYSLTIDAPAGAADNAVAKFEAL